MLSEVISRAIGNPNTLNPPIGSEQLRISAVLCIVSHFVTLMLTKAIVSHPNCFKKKRYTTNKVTKSLIINYVYCNCLTNRYTNWLFIACLLLTRPSKYVNVLDLVKLFV
uniref:Uncharacterized protein n=1 Tax=Lygus hesperus TaxID=30085 RepID=A0A146LZS2_LYGHE